MLILPNEIEEFTYSNLVEDFNAYDPQKTYVFKEELDNDSAALYGSYYWRSVTDDNTGNIPSKQSNVWSRYGISNRNAMLDQKSNSKSTTQADFEEANATTTIDYNKNTRIYDIANDKVYDCIQNSTAGTLLTNTSFFTETTFDLIVEFERGLSTALVIGKFEASQIIIENLDSLGAVVSTQTFDFGVNENVFDIYSYAYEPYSVAVGRDIYTPIAWAGVKIRVTLKPSTNKKAECGFLVAGEPIYVGQAQDDYKKKPSSFIKGGFDDFGEYSPNKRAEQDKITVTTKFESDLFSEMSRVVKEYKDEVVCFIVDETGNSKYEGLVTLGVTQSPSLSLRSTFNTSVITWDIVEVP